MAVGRSQLPMLCGRNTYWSAPAQGTRHKAPQLGCQYFPGNRQVGEGRRGWVAETGAVWGGNLSRFIYVANIFVWLRYKLPQPQLKQRQFELPLPAPPHPPLPYPAPSLLALSLTLSLSVSVCLCCLLPPAAKCNFLMKLQTALSWPKQPRLCPSFLSSPPPAFLLLPPKPSPSALPLAKQTQHCRVLRFATTKLNLTFKFAN